MIGHETEPRQAEPAWFVAHTRPRCEKKLAEYCLREGFHVVLPLYRSIKKYPSKTVVFEKPLFPNYLFLKLRPSQRKTLYGSDYVANVLDVPDQRGFEEQLGAILSALDANYEVVAMPQITEGKRVRIKAGPLRGLEGLVQERQGRWLVLLRLDFISQAAGVRVDAADLEILE